MAFPLLRKTKSLFRSLLNLPQPWVEASLCEKRYRVRAGTIREPDYDDAWLLSCAMHSETIFDIGANVGQSAFIILQNPNLKNLVLVDPNPAALTHAAENLIHNYLIQKVRLICAFIGNKDKETVNLWTVGTGAAGSVYKGHAQTASRRNSSLLVPTVTLDTLTRDLGIYPDFVKVDVEGAESLVLEGARKLTLSHNPRFLVEMHHQPELSMAENAQKVLVWCSSVNYAAWYLKEKTLLDSPDQISHRGRCHLLLQTKEESIPEWLKSIPQGAPLQ
jgi:FkbM family methyltransferase